MHRPTGMTHFSANFGHLTGTESGFELGGPKLKTNFFFYENKN